jgi:hypothetical protein
MQNFIIKVPLPMRCCTARRKIYRAGSKAGQRTEDDAGGAGPRSSHKPAALPKSGRAAVAAAAQQTRLANEEVRAVVLGTVVLGRVVRGSVGSWCRVYVVAWGAVGGLHASLNAYQVTSKMGLAGSKNTAAAAAGKPTVSAKRKGRELGQ